jgi:addiction module RelE/StbE family toxin
MPYRVLVKPKAEKDILRAPHEIRKALYREIQALADDPWNPGTAPLKGALKEYRKCRVGDYRIGYKVEKETVTVLVMRVLPRGEIYKAMKNLIG